MIQVLKTLDQRKRAEQSVELSRAEKLSELSRASNSRGMQAEQSVESLPAENCRHKRPKETPGESAGRNARDARWCARRNSLCGSLRHVAARLPYAAAGDMSPPDFLRSLARPCSRRLDILPATAAGSCSGASGTTACSFTSGAPSKERLRAGSSSAAGESERRPAPVRAGL